MALRDDIDELDDALYDWATQTHWQGRRKAPLVTSTTNPLTGGSRLIPAMRVDEAFRVDNRKVILIGDSLTSANFAQVTFNATTGVNDPTLPEGYDENWCFATLANAMLGLPYEFINAGKSGEKTAWMVTNLALVMAANPDAGEVWICGGVNDINIDGEVVGQEAMVSNLTTMINAALSAGMRVVWSTTTQAAASQGWSDAKSAGVSKGNTRVKAIFQNNPLVDIVDVHARLLLTTYDADTAYMYDGLHPSNAGNLEWALLVVDKIQDRCPAPLPAISDPLEVYTIDATKLQLISDPLQLGTPGAAAGAGITGTHFPISLLARQSGSAGDTAAASMVPAPNGIGKALKLVVDAATGACVFRCGDLNASATPLAGGVKTYAEFFVKCSGLVNFTNIYLEQLCLSNGTPNSTSTYFGSIVGAADGITHAGEFTLRMRTPVLTIPPDATSISYIRHYIYIVFAGIGGGTFEIYQRTLNVVED